MNDNIVKYSCDQLKHLSSYNELELPTNTVFFKINIISAYIYAVVCYKRIRSKRKTKKQTNSFVFYLSLTLSNISKLILHIHAPPRVLTPWLYSL